MLRVEDLSVAYHGPQILHSLTLDFFPDKVTCIIGPNGAGKTSLMKALMGMAPVTAGAVQFYDQDITLLATATRVRMGLALCPEGRQVFPRLSVADNLLLGAQLRRDGPNIRQDIQQYCEWFPILKTRYYEMAGNLSGGEQQMLAIARTLMSRPRYVLLDEPSLGLSPQMVDFVGNIIRQIYQRGIGVVLVEQNAAMALEVSDYAYIIEVGTCVGGDAAQTMKEQDLVRRTYLGV